MSLPLNTRFTKLLSQVSIIALSSLALGQPPAPRARIVSYDSPNEGRLRVSYSDGTTWEIPKEQGRFDVMQAAFADIQIASDRRRIGWLARYAICAQLYPCSAELVIFQARQKPRYIAPDHGVIWKWALLANGRQVVVQYGFPHGDATGAYALYESDSGRQFAAFTPGSGTAPNGCSKCSLTRNEP